MIIAVALLILALVFLFVLGVRSSDLPEPEPVSPFAHLDERKARIYEGLRDLQFEFRLGKLSDEDYQRTKTDLQKELAAVLAETDRIKGKLPAAKAPLPTPSENVCVHCNARFPLALKFCGQCGKPMSEVDA
jgi:hypothetical protein